MIFDYNNHEVEYRVVGTYHPATLHEPEEQPEIEIVSVEPDDELEWYALEEACWKNYRESRL
jgi:hypothetical protein